MKSYWHQNGDGTETRVFVRNGMFYFGCVTRWNLTKESVLLGIGESK